MSTMQALLAARNEEVREAKMKRKQMKRGPTVPPPRQTLQLEGEPLAVTLASAVSTAAEVEELWCGAFVASYLGWCQFTVNTQRGTEAERKVWMANNGITYDDLRKNWLPKQEIDSASPVHTLNDIKLTSGYVVPKGTLAWCQKQQGGKYLVQYKVRDSKGRLVKQRDRQREVFETERTDIEPAQLLLQWGWRPKSHVVDSDSEDDSE